MDVRMIAARHSSGDIAVAQTVSCSSGTARSPVVTPIQVASPAVFMSTPLAASAMPWMQPQVTWPTFAWMPHPYPHPTIPASTFWGSGIFGGQRSWPATPCDAMAAARLTGGWPLPGMAPTGWTPGLWPSVIQTPTVTTPVFITSPFQGGPVICKWLVPNPINPDVPHVMWDVSQHPLTAKRITGRELVADITRYLDEQATNPPSDKILIICDIGMAQNMWGPIVVQKSRITVWDVFLAIYEYFQKQMTRKEVDYLASLASGNLKSMEDACYKRCLRAPALPGYEWQQGMRRVDCLGDKTVFWVLLHDAASLRLRSDIYQTLINADYGTTIQIYKLEIMRI
ncbi:hypothetical protein A0H81_12226 [Grifola frondosa]|uniref:DUF6699 domain-containing protein n=1 Tax=Grifola frondosa TaxID=5627 RepID=A0A1C7LS44_GRIFR|nr:hypothetical protein A0H81_12226 [Grifola frondosa]